MAEIGAQWEDTISNLNNAFEKYPGQAWTDWTEVDGRLTREGTLSRRANTINATQLILSPDCTRELSGGDHTPPQFVLDYGSVLCTRRAEISASQTKHGDSEEINSNYQLEMSYDLARSPDLKARELTDSEQSQWQEYLESIGSIVKPKLVPHIKTYLGFLLVPRIVFDESGSQRRVSVGSDSLALAHDINSSKGRASFDRARRVADFVLEFLSAKSAD